MSMAVCQWIYVVSISSKYSNDKGNVEIKDKVVYYIPLLLT